MQGSGLAKLRTLLKAMEGKSGKKRIVLHMDVNRTLIQIDPAGGKSMADVLNNNLSAVCYGVLSTSNQWKAVIGPEPTSEQQELIAKIEDSLSSTVDGTRYITYDDFIDEVLVPTPHEEMAALRGREASDRWDQVAEARRHYKNAFSDPGHPGEEFRVYWEKLRTAMKRPSGQGDWYVLPSFWSMVNSLSEADWPFSVVIRTFGKDLPEIQEEWRRFVLGELEVKPSGPILKELAEAYRASADTPLSSLVPTGSVYRCKTGTFMKWGPAKAPAQLDDETQVPEGYAPVSTEELYRQLTAAPDAGKPALKVFGVVDFYPWWSANSEAGAAGKVFPIRIPRPPSDTNHPYQVFFDDNIFYPPETETIVDIRSVETNQFIQDETVQRAFLAAVAPYQAITNIDYFTDQLVERVLAQYRWEAGDSAAPKL